MRIVQLIRRDERRVAIVNGAALELLDSKAPQSVYALALRALTSGRTLAVVIGEAARKQVLDYEAVHESRSEWRLLPAFDHPDDPAHCVVTGTGLTHRASAEHRTAMHRQAAAPVTDSMRMYQMGLEGGHPAAGQIGVQPEWFYKGNGRMLRAHGEPLEIPPYGWDGGEEPEVAGAYIVSSDGTPFRVGLTIANEFSDHQMEKKNYLYLAPSKLRNCSIGPELSIGDVEFENVAGTVAILRLGAVIWQKEILTGQQNMSHTVANLEHHHFKYDLHRQPDDVHIHFFGADAFSFGDGILLQDGDVMKVSFPALGRPLRNSLRLLANTEPLISVMTL